MTTIKKENKKESIIFPTAGSFVFHQKNVEQLTKAVLK